VPGTRTALLLLGQRQKLEAGQERVVAFPNQCGTCMQSLKKGQNASTWTRLSCRGFAANAVRLQLHVLAYNLGDFMQTLALPKTAETWSLTRSSAQRL
jgi:hypothetical protein